MLIQIDFEFFVPTDQGWSFRVGRALSREAGPCKVSWGNIFEVAAKVGFFIYIYI